MVARHHEGEPLVVLAEVLDVERAKHRVYLLTATLAAGRARPFGSLADRLDQRGGRLRRFGELRAAVEIVPLVMLAARRVDAASRDHLATLGYEIEARISLVALVDAHASRERQIVVRAAAARLDARPMIHLESKVAAQLLEARVAAVTRINVEDELIGLESDAHVAAVVGTTADHVLGDICARGPFGVAWRFAIGVQRDRLPCGAKV